MILSRILPKVLRPLPYASSAIAALVAASLLAAGPCLASPADSSGTLYVLVTPPSALEVGCQGPCACPIVSFPTYGSFVLVKTGSDPLYTNYAVERYIASFNNGPGAIAIVGSGQYRIGGEVALVQQLTLDLEIQGQPAEHFDSGLQPVSTPFPQLDLECAVHGFACLDSVLRVDAKPVDPAGSGPPAMPPTGLRAVAPNPARNWTQVAFDLERPGPVEIAIVDVAGRRVRALASGWFAGSGPQSVTWEGRSDDGRPAPAGVYWVVMRWPGGSDRRRFVKLD